MEEALVARLLAAAGVAALAGTRVYWVERPQRSALPAIVLSVVSPGRTYTHGGADDVSSPRVQLDAWGVNYLAAKSLARAARAALEPPATVGGIRFTGAFVEDERDFRPEDVGGGGKVFRVSLDLTVWFSPV